ncbi:MAG: hypothetical protein NVS3B3_21530 [Aquirhabdus sp.]
MRVRQLIAKDNSLHEDSYSVELNDSEIADYMANAEPQTNAADEVLTAVEEYILAGSTPKGLIFLGEQLAAIKIRAIERINEEREES